MHVRAASARAVAACLLATIACLGAGASVAAAAPGRPAHGARPARAAWNRTVLSVRGRTLHWRRVPGASRYVIAIIAGSHPAYRVVGGVTFTPRALPRQ